MSRQPTSSNFPSNLQLSIVPPPNNQVPVNVLILLHGLGDSNESFAQLAKQLSLPETTCISLQAPSPLPFDLGGFHWGDDITFDQSKGAMDYDTGFEKSSRIIKEDVIETVLLQKYGYKPRNILLLGFGQGGMATLATALTYKTELGGIISIGGPLPSTTSHVGTNEAKNKTPVIVLGGSSQTLVTQSALSNLKQAFQVVEYIKWPRAGDGMPRNRDEMLPIMKFFARRLQSRSGVPEGAVEVG
ncbi:MAG: hypothetical protein L6R41_002268 [Letrouitia leprolyta]|nr:MAG: hypothetical protein L6R41_002268 [Letrouitia leprolyta]